MSLNVHGLQASLGSFDNRLKEISSDHEKVKLENLRLMFHFKTGQRDMS